MSQSLKPSSKIVSLVVDYEHNSNHFSGRTGGSRKRGRNASQSVFDDQPPVAPLFGLQSSYPVGGNAFRRRTDQFDPLAAGYASRMRRPGKPRNECARESRSICWQWRKLPAARKSQWMEYKPLQLGSEEQRDTLTGKHSLSPKNSSSEIREDKKMKDRQMITLTQQMLHDASTQRGGWKKKQVAALGVPWPLPRGWLKGLVGREVPVEKWAEFCKLSGGEDSHALVEKWLGAVNQPVVNHVESGIKELLQTISDGGNFSEKQCKTILLEIVATYPLTTG